MGYRYLQDYKKEDGSNGIRFCDESEAGYIMLPIEQYHGLKKAVRIVNDRALQQIDKSKTDKYGFRLLRADRKRFKKHDGTLWLVTKETPYSSKIALHEARALIENKLREVYYWVDEMNLEDYVDEETETLDRYRHQIYESDLPKICKQWHDKDHRDRFEFLGDNSEKGRATMKCWQAHDSMIVEISKISVNYAQGLYEVSYWATEPI